MYIKITAKGKEELIKTGFKNFKIFVQSYGWTGPVFGMAQGEPENNQATYEESGMTFSMDKEIAEIINFFEIDYQSGWLRKGFVIYPNGSKRRC